MTNQRMTPSLTANGSASLEHQIETPPKEFTYLSDHTLSYVLGRIKLLVKPNGRRFWILRLVLQSETLNRKGTYRI